MMKFIFDYCRRAPAAVTRPSSPPFASEHGGARLNFLIVVFVIAVVGYGVMNYAPVAYKSLEYKDVMQSKVDQAVAFGHTGEWVRAQLRATANEYDVPPEAVIAVAQKNGRMEAVVRYTRPVPMPGFIYNYEFDHTARSSNMLSNTALNY